MVEVRMPRMYRSMKQEGDGMAKIEQSATGLGVRAALEGSQEPNSKDVIDIFHDEEMNVYPNRKGMSVVPNWSMLPKHRLPTHLRIPGFSGQRAASDVRIWRIGEGTFEDGSVSAHLRMTANSERHGYVGPAMVMSLHDYRHALVQTRLDWVIDETP